MKGLSKECDIRLPGFPSTPYLHTVIHLFIHISYGASIMLRTSLQTNRHNYPIFSLSSLSTLLFQ